MSAAPLFDRWDAVTLVAFGLASAVAAPFFLRLVLRSIALENPNFVYNALGRWVMAGGLLFLVTTSPAAAEHPMRLPLGGALLGIGLVLGLLSQSLAPTRRSLDRSASSPGSVAMGRLLVATCVPEALALGRVLHAADPRDSGVALNLVMALVGSGHADEARPIHAAAGPEGLTERQRAFWGFERGLLRKSRGPAAVRRVLLLVIAGFLLALLAFALVMIRRILYPWDPEGPLSRWILIPAGAFLLNLGLGLGLVVFRKLHAARWGGPAVEDAMGLLLANGLAAPAVALGRSRLARCPTDNGVRLALAAALAATGARVIAREELERVWLAGLRADQLGIHEDLRARLAGESASPP